jgi:hypothetical protein
VCAGLALCAFGLVQVLPRGRAANALIERAPSWAAGFTYSLYLFTGGRIGQHLFDEILGEMTERRLRRAQDAPLRLDDFLVFHFQQAGGDRPWLNYLMREALTNGSGPIPHQNERAPVIHAQVREIAGRQGDGLAPADLDPALLRLMVFALSNYPRLLPQITKMTTGKDPADPSFIDDWSHFLRQIANRLAPNPPMVTVADAPSPTSTA